MTRCYVPYTMSYDKIICVVQNCDKTVCVVQDCDKTVCVIQNCDKKVCVVQDCMCSRRHLHHEKTVHVCITQGIWIIKTVRLSFKKRYKTSPDKRQYIQYKASSMPVVCKVEDMLPGLKNQCCAIYASYVKQQLVSHKIFFVEQ